MSRFKALQYVHLRASFLTLNINAKGLWSELLKWSMCQTRGQLKKYIFSHNLDRAASMSNFSGCPAISLGPQKIEVRVRDFDDAKR